MMQPRSRLSLSSRSLSPWYRHSLTVFLLSVGWVGCEKPERCTVNVECGNQHLCRSGACKPKCDTYLACDTGEACVDGACEVPSPDYCSQIVPTLTPPEMGPFAPCPPSETGAGEAMVGAGEMMMSPANPASAGAMMSTAGATGESGGAETAAGSTSETAGVVNETAGAAAGAAAGETTAGATAGETAGETLEVVGGQAE